MRTLKTIFLEFWNEVDRWLWIIGLILSLSGVALIYSSTHLSLIPSEQTLYLKQIFSKVPYQLHIKEEKFYHALLSVICGASGITSQSEYSISHGRIDVVIEIATVIYIIEIKFNASAETALSQIEERRYYEPFLGRKKSIILLGLSFKREPKNFEITYAIKNISSKT